MKKQLKILLAGYGDVAGRTAEILLQQGHSVAAVCRSEQSECPPGLTLIQADLRDAERLRTIVAQGFDAVVVTVTPDSFTDKGYRDSYIAVAQSFADVLQKDAEEVPSLLIWVSSTSVYGQGRGEWVDEQTVPRPDSFSGKRLLEAEQLLGNLPSSIKTLIVRFSGIYGPDRNRMLNQVRDGAIAPSQPVVWSNRIHSMDCAGVLAHLLGRFQAGEALASLYLATDCQPAPLHEVQQWLAERMGVAVRSSKPAPSRGNRRCSNQRLLQTGYLFRYPSYREGFAAMLVK